MAKRDQPRNALRRPFKGLVTKVDKSKKKSSVQIQGDIKVNSNKKTTTQEVFENDVNGRLVKKTTTVTEEYIVQEKPVRPKTKTQIIFVLDKSSSMGTGKDLTIMNFNKQVETIAQMSKDNTDVEISLVTFNDNVTIQTKHSEAGSVPQLTSYSYNPYGNTALYDGIAAAINIAKEKSYDIDSRNAVLIAIFTDGEENASKIAGFAGIKQMIETQNRTGNWTFTVTGPRNSLHLMEAIGILPGNIVGFTPESLVSRTWAGNVGVASASVYMGARARGESSTYNSHLTASNMVGADPSIAGEAKIDSIIDWNTLAKADLTNPAKWPFPTVKVGDIVQGSTSDSTD